MKKRSQKTAGRHKSRKLLSYACGFVPVRILQMAFLFVLAAAITMTTPVCAEEGYDRVAGSGSMGETKENLAPYGMTPVTGELIEDGEYVVSTECSSSFFRIEEARLTVQDGKMTARLTMSSSSYLLVFPGTAGEAAAAPYEDYIPSVEIDTRDTFTIPVEALDTELDLAAFSKRKKAWYPRKILFHASDIPAECLRFEYPDYERIAEALALYDAENKNGAQGDGEADQSKDAEDARSTSKDGTGNTMQNIPESGKAEYDNADNKGNNGKNGGSGGGPQAVQMEIPDGEYSIEVVLTGGSGRASVTSPTWLTVREGGGYAKLLWSSPHYDYMILDGCKYLNETTDGGNSTFTIPVTVLDTPVEVIADTTAMGEPVEIPYTLTFYTDSVGKRSRVPQEGAKSVLTGAALFIVIGGIINHFVKKRRS